MFLETPLAECESEPSPRNRLVTAFIALALLCGIELRRCGLDPGPSHTVFGDEFAQRIDFGPAFVHGGGHRTRCLQDLLLPIQTARKSPIKDAGQLPFELQIKVAVFFAIRNLHGERNQTNATPDAVIAPTYARLIVTSDPDLELGQELKNSCGRNRAVIESPPVRALMSDSLACTAVESVMRLHGVEDTGQCLRCVRAMERGALKVFNR